MILTCRCIGVSDSLSKVSSRFVPSSCFSVTVNTQFRVPWVLKYFSLTHLAPLLGCRLHASTSSSSNVLLRSFAFLPFRWFCKLSGEERPRGSLPAFASGDVATRIPSITAGHSLFPRSCARTAMGRPRSLLSPRGAIRGFHVPLMEVRRVRCLLWAGRYMGHESVVEKRCSHLRYRFGSSAIAISARST